MRLQLGTFEKKRLMVVGPMKLEERLAHTCFRGQHVALAGNFCKYASLKDLFDDSDFREEALDQILMSLEEGDLEFSFEVEMPYVVGWDATAPLSDFDGDDLEQRNLNARATAFFVKREAKRLAPQTDVVTMCLKRASRQNTGELALLIATVYPGNDVGELIGDMTLREQRVWFDWHQPGQPLQGSVTRNPVVLMDPMHHLKKRFDNSTSL